LIGTLSAGSFFAVELDFVRSTLVANGKTVLVSLIKTNLIPEKELIEIANLKMFKKF
jgi:hypothetical protein